MKYPKLQTLWKRDMVSKKKKGVILPGEYSCDEFKNIKKWLVTEKIDGTNVRIFYDVFKNKQTISFGGRTDNAQMPTFLLQFLQKKFSILDLQEVFKLRGDQDSLEVRLFGEGYGAKIQKGGGNYRQGPSFILFDVWIDGWWLNYTDVKRIAGSLGIECVPEIGVMMEEEIIEFIKSEPKSLIAENKDHIMEGVVVKSQPLMMFRDGKRFIAWKLKVNDYCRYNLLAGDKK